MSEPNIQGGYVLLPRKIIESEIFKKPPLFLKVWLYLLLRAQHNEYKNLKRGQVVTSIPEIMEACSWYVGYRKEQPSKKQVYQILKWLRNSDEASCEDDAKTTRIGTAKATQGMLVNIDDYGFYQDPRNYGSNDESISEEETAATREQRQGDNINNNDNKLKKKNINTPQNNKFSEDSIEIILSKELFNYMRKNNPGAKEPNFQTWAKSIDLMLRRDNRTAEGIREMIEFSQTHDFWMGNILSTSKLREKYDQLAVQSSRAKLVAKDFQEDLTEKPYWLDAES